MSLYYTNEEGAQVCVHDFDPEANIYEEKTTLLYVFIKFEGDDEELLILEQELLDGMSRLHLDYIGWRLFEGWLEIYFYGEQAKGFESVLNDILKPKYQFESGHRKDKKYETYYQMLLPNEQEYHAIQSEEIIADLLEAGDDLEAEHCIEYHVMFMTSSQRQRFSDAIQEQGFTLLQEFMDEKAEDDYVYGSVFSQKGPISMEQLDHDLHKALPFIKKEHGRYEGWGTQAVSMSEEA